MMSDRIIFIDDCWCVVFVYYYEILDVGLCFDFDFKYFGLYCGVYLN